MKNITIHVRNPISKFIALTTLKLSLSECRGCNDTEYHTHHFTPLGRFLYTGSWARK